MSGLTERPQLLPSAYLDDALSQGEHAVEAGAGRGGPDATAAPAVSRGGRAGAGAEVAPSPAFERNTAATPSANALADAVASPAAAPAAAESPRTFGPPPQLFLSI